MIKVGINGYGTIGKRVADAVSKQDDMEVLGVTKTRPTFEAELARQRNFPLYVAIPENIPKFESAGYIVEGTLEDLLKKVDIIVDCTPGKKGAKYKELYLKYGVKAIWQGGEKHELAGTSFNALANYNEAWGKDFVRVVSCNTTGLTRTLYPLHKEFGIKNVEAIMVRRAADPGNSKKGPINAIIPVINVPSHHGPDVQTVIHDLNIQTMAVAVPSTIMHLHCIVVKLEKDARREEVIEVWEKTPRVTFVTADDGFVSTAEIMEYARNLGRPWSDLNEIAVWKDSIKTIGNKLYYYQAIHQESDVVPENIDCIRSMMMVEKDNMASIIKTNKALVIN